MRQTSLLRWVTVGLYPKRKVPIVRTRCNPFSSVCTDQKKEKDTPKESIVPGLIASGLGCSIAFPFATFMGESLMKMNYPDLPSESIISPISGIPLAIIFGLSFNHFFPEASKKLLPGAKVASKQILQLGIVCVGLKLSAFDLLSTGLIGIPAVAASVVMGLTVIPKVGQLLGLPEKMSTLIAAGTSICGITAISAVSPSIKANERDTSFAIANVVTFGTLGLLCYPYLANLFMTDSKQIGMFLGLAIHDTSQVVGAAVTYSSVFNDVVVLKVATITKLTRNLCLAGTVPYLTLKSMNKKEDISFIKSLKKYTPTFVLGFVGMSILRTTGDIFISEDIFDNWNQCVSFIGNTLGSKVLLGTAMTGVGLSTQLSTLKGVGPKPFLLGAIGATTVATTGFCISYILLHSLY